MGVLRAMQRGPGAEHKQQLPAERVEIPVAIRIGRQIPLERTRPEIKRERSGHGQAGPAHHHPEHRREEHHQYGVELQHIEIERFGLQEQRMVQDFNRMLDKR